MCHGVPSPKVYRKYVSEISSGRKLIKFDFREKSYWGWGTAVELPPPSGYTQKKGASGVFVGRYQSPSLAFSQHCLDFWGKPFQFTVQLVGWGSRAVFIWNYITNIEEYYDFTAIRWRRSAIFESENALKISRIFSPTPSSKSPQIHGRFKLPAERHDKPKKIFNICYNTYRKSKNEKEYF